MIWPALTILAAFLILGFVVARTLQRKAQQAWTDFKRGWRNGF